MPNVAGPKLVFDGPPCPIDRGVTIRLKTNSGVVLALRRADLFLKNLIILSLGQLFDALAVCWRVRRCMPAAAIVISSAALVFEVERVLVPDRNQAIAVALRPHLARPTPEWAFDFKGDG